MNNASELLSHFSNVKDKGGGKYTCDCPICNRAGHVYVSIGRDSAAMFCQGCKENGAALVEAVGLKKSDLFFKSEKRLPASSRVHIYHNADGSVFGKKNITKRPDGKKNCSWSICKDGQFHKGLGGKKAPVFNLPRLASTQDTVYFAEGEKDCDTLTQMGFTATTMPNGANQRSWPEGVNEYLLNREIVVLTDNDDAGEEYGEFIARNTYNIASSVRIIPAKAVCDEIATKGDISDAVEIIGLHSARERIAELVPNTEPWTPAAAANEVPRFYDDGTFLHNVMGDYLTVKHHICRINGIVHIYEDGLYKPDEELIQGYMLRLLPRLTDQKRREVLKYIKVSMDTPERELSPANLIPFRSKVYDIDTDSFLDYSPELVFLSRFPYDYKPDAPMSEFVFKVLYDIACGDQKVMDLLFEAIGNCFFRKNIYRGSILLYGHDGSNGKSTLLNMIIQLLGSDNVSTLDIKDLNEKFRLHQIYGKYANIGDDISDQYLEDSSIFKKLVTGESVTAERKGQDPVSFRSFAKLMFAANGLPKTADKSKAFISRMLPVPLMADFSKKSDCDTSLKDRHWNDEEMEYLLRMAMMGLKRLRRNNGFTIPECVEAAKKEYETENNSVLGFLSEGVEVHRVPTKLLYAKYADWCRVSGLHCTFTHPKFTREVRKYTKAEVRSLRTSIEGKKTAVKCFYIESSEGKTPNIASSVATDTENLPDIVTDCK